MSQADEVRNESRAHNTNIVLHLNGSLNNASGRQLSRIECVVTYVDCDDKLYKQVRLTEGQTFFYGDWDGRACVRKEVTCGGKASAESGHSTSTADFTATEWTEVYQTQVRQGGELTKKDGFPNPAKIVFSSTSEVFFTLHLENSERNPVFHDTAHIQSGSPLSFVVGHPSSSLRKIHVHNPSADIIITVLSRADR